MKNELSASKMQSNRLTNHIDFRLTKTNKLSDDKKAVACNLMYLL